MIDTSFAHYRVLAKLGEGGMGEVYRARDSRLNRDVAIKVLPAAFANDTERLARFTREAQTLAALNHPNIAGIYGIEESNGVRALVMELVEGEDLSVHIGRGPLPLSEALPIAKGIAEALEAAHEQGIVHRDLKPANVKVRPDGTVKVLDFGLAKAPVPDGSSATAAALNSPTFTSPAMTAMGVILGTAAYMSPEQAKGRPIDKRSDIWAFGVVLYEMLTGTRVFEGESVAETLGQIFSREPDMEMLPEGTPAGLEALIARCLVKDPRNRLRDIGDARLQLEEATVRRADSANDAAPARTLLLRQRRPWGFWLALPVVAVTAAALAWYARPSAPAPLVRLSIALPQGDQAVTVPAISPDGQVIAYAAGRTPATSRLYVRRLDEVAAREVAGSVAAQYPFFSADGRTVAFFADGKLRRAPVTGGGAIDIAAAPSAWGGTWGPDGWIVYVPSLPAGLWRVRAEGGAAEQLTKPDGAAAGYAHVFPQSVAGSNDLTFGYWGQTFYTAFFSPAGRTWRKITPPTTTQGLFVGVYARSGHVIAGDVAGGVRAAEWTPAATAPANPETVVLDNVYWELSIERPWLNVAENGTAVYVPGNPSSRHLVWVDRQGQATRLPGDADQILRATVSRNGRRVVYDGNRSTEWVLDLATGTRTRIVSNVRSWHGGWLPGDDRLVVSSNKDGDWDLYTVGTSGNDRLEPLLRQPFNQFAQAVAADGTIVYAEDHPVTGSDLRTLAPDGRTSALLVTPFNEMSASLSADDRFMAYVSDEGGVYDVYAIAASGKGPRVQISLDGGTGPLWSRDGRELFYRVGGDLVSVDVQTTGALVVGARHKVLDVSEYDAGFLHEFDVSADGKRFLLIQTDADARPTRLDVILNWFGELKRKVAAR